MKKNISIILHIFLAFLLAWIKNYKAEYFLVALGITVVLLVSLHLYELSVNNRTKKKHVQEIENIGK
jgi:hypothetical protein